MVKSLKEKMLERRIACLEKLVTSKNRSSSRSKNESADDDYDVDVDSLNGVLIQLLLRNIEDEVILPSDTGDFIDWRQVASQWDTIHEIAYDVYGGDTTFGEVTSPTLKQTKTIFDNLVGLGKLEVIDFVNLRLPANRLFDIAYSLGL